VLRDRSAQGISPNGSGYFFSRGGAAQPASSRADITIDDILMFMCGLDVFSKTHLLACGAFHVNSFPSRRFPNFKFSCISLQAKL
jgi:hypothetical protein